MSTRGTVQTSGDLRTKWDQRYRDCDHAPVPAAVLTENLHLLPTSGRALDLACGLGANALILASLGLDVAAWDLSPVAIERLRSEAARRGVKIDAQVRDLCARPPESESFDVVLVCYFLDRNVAPSLMGALRPGGVLFYQTFSREAVSKSGPSNPEFRLAKNELLTLFHGLVVRFYRDEGVLGDTGRGTRDLAQLIAQKPG